MRPDPSEHPANSIFFNNLYAWGLVMEQRAAASFRDIEP